MTFVPQRIGSYSPAALTEDYGQQERGSHGSPLLAFCFCDSFHGGQYV